jgi:uncharacterized protein YecT (DUF1311 family)
MASLLILVLLFFPQTQEPKPNPIDKALEACIDKDPSTAGMTRCIDTAYEAWDKELNRNYATLMGRLKPAGKQSLKNAQVEWLRFRDAEFKLIDDIYSTLQGTMYIPMRVSERVEIVKKRALALASYSDLAEEAEP